MIDGPEHVEDEGSGRNQEVRPDVAGLLADWRLLDLEVGVEAVAVLVLLQVY